LQKRLPEKKNDPVLESEVAQLSHGAQVGAGNSKPELGKPDSGLAKSPKTDETPKKGSSYGAQAHEKPAESWLGAEDAEVPSSGADRRESRQAEMAAALARVMGDEAPSWISPSVSPAETAKESVAASHSAPVPVSHGRFLVQVASLPSMEQAHRVKDNLVSKGYSVQIEKANIVGAGLSHRVQVMGFPTHEAASDAREKIKDGFGMRGIIVRE